MEILIDYDLRAIVSASMYFIDCKFYSLSLYLDSVQSVSAFQKAFEISGPKSPKQMAHCSFSHVIDNYYLGTLPKKKNGKMWEF